MNEQKETILITGSSGRIGYPLAKRLAESFNVVGFDRRAPSHPPSSAECLYVDLTSDESLRRGLQAIRELHGNRIVSVIHRAGARHDRIAMVARRSDIRFKHQQPDHRSADHRVKHSAGQDQKHLWRLECIDRMIRLNFLS